MLCIGYEAGQKAEHDRLWDGVFSGYNWQCKFYGSSWNDNTFYPNQDIKPSGYANNLFSLCEITDFVGRLKECGVTFDTSNITARSDNMFNYATKILNVPYLDLRNATYSAGVLGSMFSNCYALVTIEGIHLAEDGSQIIGDGAFTECKALENVTFYGTIAKSIYDNTSSVLNFQWSPKLTHDSLMSIINALKDYSGTDTWKTITFGSVNLAKLSATELEIMDKKQWNYR